MAKRQNRTYSLEFKRRMVERMIGDEGIGLAALSRETGISKPSLCKWRQDAIRDLVMSDSVESADRRPEDWGPQEKLQAVLETGGMPDDKLGEYLRRKGLQEVHLEEWRLLVAKGGLEALQGKVTKARITSEAKQVRRLQKELQRKDKALAEAAALLVLQKKSPTHLGGRGRRHGPERRKLIVELIEEAVGSGARLEAACQVLGLSARTIQRWQSQPGCGEDGRRGPKSAPANKLSEEERKRLLAVLNSPQYRNLSPKQVIPSLADEGEYIASESTAYRVLHEEKMMAHRAATKPRTSRGPRRHTATGPCQVWSWDITYLKTTVRGRFFYLYIILDVWSRRIMGWTVEEEELAELGSKLVTDTCHANDVDPAGLVLHSDNGAPMRAATMVATLQKLGIVPSLSRPRVSNDNPFQESLIRTCKYSPGFPSQPFDSLEEARAWVAAFVDWYNTEHLHSAIRFVAPDDRHFGREDAILATRERVYAAARDRNPRRWTGPTRNWKPIRSVHLNPHREARTKSA